MALTAKILNLNKLYNIHILNAKYYSSKVDKKYEFKKYYEILEIPESSDQEQIRQAYIHLVKKYHPDNADGDIHKFHKIDEAFRKLIHRKSQERWDVDEVDATDVEEFDIKHTAPQHRQYLSYDGIGSGTPFQREKQYIKVRAMQAAENVLQHRIAKVTANEKTLMDKKLPFKHKIKTKYGFDRLVEDLIQESMSKGEFNNLSGCGKPLQTHQNINPYVDFVQHKINQVLIENGFTPEWITLQKEIREEKKILLDALQNERRHFAVFPLNKDDEFNWLEVVDKYSKLTDSINKKINKFNLVVPILNKQMVHVNLRVEARNILENSPHTDNPIPKICKQTNNNRRDDESHIFSFLNNVFKK